MNPKVYVANLHDQINKLMDENEELMIERDQLRAENAGLRTGYQAYERVNAELKAESERIERNRDMWKGQVERQAEELTSLRKDAERYRWLIRNAEEIYFLGVNLHLDPFYVGQDKIKEGADSDIDAAMGQGAQS